MLTALGWMTLKVLNFSGVCKWHFREDAVLDTVGFGCEQHTHCRYQILLAALGATEAAHAVFHVAVGITLLHHPLSMISETEK